jgi:Protein kinase domain
MGNQQSDVIHEDMIDCEDGDGDHPNGYYSSTNGGCLRRLSLDLCHPKPKESISCFAGLFQRDAVSIHNNIAREASDAMGSPIPDTPTHIKWRRKQLLEQESVSPGANTNGINRRDHLTAMSSIYNGLEKETEDMFPGEGETDTAIDMADTEQRPQPVDAPIPATNAGKNKNPFSSMMQTISTATGQILLLPPAVRNQQKGGGTMNGHLSPAANSLVPGSTVSAPSIIHDGPNCENELFAKYQLLEVLGVGSTSTVYRCQLRQPHSSAQPQYHFATGTPPPPPPPPSDGFFACKVIDVQQIEEKFSGMLQQFQTEIASLQRLQHPQIIQLYDVYLTPGKIFIVMELMSGGELFDYVVQKGTLTETEASTIVRKITTALVFMHSQNIIHRDLKPENLVRGFVRVVPHPDALTDAFFTAFGSDTSSC